jgi:uncharacterized protein YaaQ
LIDIGDNVMSTSTNEPTPPGDGSELVTVAEVESDVEAGAIVSELQEQGFDARVVDASTGGFLIEGVAAVRVLVPAHQAEEAKTLVDEILEEAKSIDWDDIDVGEMED